MTVASAREFILTRHWHALEDGRIQCDVCPRACKLHEGHQGLCFIRARHSDQIVLTSYGRFTGEPGECRCDCAVLPEDWR